MAWLVNTNCSCYFNKEEFVNSKKDNKVTEEDMVIIILNSDWGNLDFKMVSFMGLREAFIKMVSFS